MRNIETIANEKCFSYFYKHLKDKQNPVWCNQLCRISTWMVGDTINAECTFLSPVIGEYRLFPLRRLWSTVTLNHCYQWCGEKQQFACQNTRQRKFQNAKHIRVIFSQNVSVDILNFLYRRFTCSLLSLFPYGLVWQFSLSSSSSCIIFARINSIFVHITFQVILCTKNRSKD